MSTSFPTVASPPLSALLRVQPDDFVVTEELGFVPAGSGEHVWLFVQKRGLNTDQVAGHLARRAGVSRRNVSYSGMKDRHAVTGQWFSVWLPRAESPDWQDGMPEGIRVVEATRHSRKLQRGTHRRNRFALILRECSGDVDAAEQLLEKIRQTGVPNYYGEQRFGRDGDNVAYAMAMFEGRNVAGDRHRRGIYLSAARAYLFNQVLSRRVAEGSWNCLLPGEAVILAGKNSFFTIDGIDSLMLDRLEKQDVHPSGPLWGEGELPSRDVARALEESVVSVHRTLADGLAAAGLRQERRALRLCPADIRHRWVGSETLSLEFSLPRGAYATAVMRELASYRNMAGAAVLADSGD